MLPDDPTSSARAPDAVPAAGWLRRWALPAGFGLLLMAAAAALAWGLAELLADRGRWAAPLAAAAAMGLVALPLAGLLLRLLRQVEDTRQRLAQIDTIDTATGVASRHHFLALAEREWARARRYGDAAALLVVDVDRFHALCEMRGTAAGEAVLRALAADNSPTLRGGDALARFGGGQLVVWLAQADALGALDVAERIRERTESLDIGFQQKTLRVTVSVGVAALRPAHPNLSALIEDAEAAVQAARQTGGNCVRAAPIDPLRLRKIGPSVGDNQAAGPY
jgi:diguanylate cyclase (GGDEF)-like protein